MRRFQLYGNSIEFSDAVMQFNKIYLYFLQLANIKEEFVSTYKEFGSVCVYREKVTEYIFHSVKEAIELLIDQLIAQGIYDVSVDRVVIEYSEYILEPWLNAYEGIEDQYLRLELNEMELKAKREDRKANRRRLIGGGFGIQGAVKGIFTAEAFNTTTGVFHGMVNTIGNSFTKISNAKKADTIYHAPETIQILKEGIFYTMIRLHVVYCKYIGFNLSALPFQEQRATSMMQNFYRIPKCDRKQAICECLMNSPYYFYIYEKAVDEFGDSANELSALARTFGMEKRLMEYKQNVLNTEFIITSDLSYYEAQQMKIKLQEKMKLLGVKTCKRLEEFLNLLHDLEIRERTYDGIVYPTKEQAQIAKSDAEYIAPYLEEAQSCTNLSRLHEIYQTIQKSCSTEHYVQQALEKIEVKIEDVDYNQRKEEISRHCEGFLFELYTMENIQNIKNALDSLEQKFDIEATEQRESLTRMIDQYNLLKKEAILYKNYTPIWNAIKYFGMSVVIGCIGGLCFKIPILGWLLGIGFILISGLIWVASIVSFFSVFSSKIQNYPKTECEEAYQYLTSHGETVENVKD